MPGKRKERNAYPAFAVPEGAGNYFSNESYQMRIAALSALDSFKARRSSRDHRRRSPFVMYWVEFASICGTSVGTIRLCGGSSLLITTCGTYSTCLEQDADSTSRENRRIPIIGFRIIFHSLRVLLVERRPFLLYLVFIFSSLDQGSF